MSTEEYELTPALLVRLFAVLERLQASVPDPARGRVLEKMRPLRNRIAHSAGPHDDVIREFEILLPDIAEYLKLIESSSLGSPIAQLMRMASSIEAINNVLSRVIERDEARLRTQPALPAQQVPSSEKSAAQRLVESALASVTGPPVRGGQVGDPALPGDLAGIVNRIAETYCRLRIGEYDVSYDFADGVARDVAAEIIRWLSDRSGGWSIAAVSFRVADRHISKRVRVVADSLPVSPGVRAGNLESLLNGLPRRQYDVLLLRIILGLSADEVAGILGVTAGAVRTAHHRALSRLRSALALVLEPSPAPARAEVTGAPHAGSVTGLLLHTRPEPGGGVTTYPYATTRTRTEALVDQFDLFLQYAGVPEISRTKVLNAVSQRWLDRVAVYLVDSENRMVLEVAVGIDWAAHADFASISPLVITELPSWEQGAASEIRTLGRRFGAKATALGQTPRLWIRFTKAIRDNAELHRSLREQTGFAYGDGPADEVHRPGHSGRGHHVRAGIGESVGALAVAFEVAGTVVAANIGSEVHIGHIKNVAVVLRLLDELRTNLGDACAPTSTIEIVDDLRAEARKSRPSKDVAGHLMGKLADRGLGERFEELGERFKELAQAFDALF